MACLNFLNSEGVNQPDMQLLIYWFYSLEHLTPAVQDLPLSNRITHVPH